MDPIDSTQVTLWLHQMAEGDSAAFEKIFGQYFERLVGVARRQLLGGARRDADEEDVAAEAIASFFQGVKRNRFPDLNDRKDLWRLLVTFVLRKSANRLKHVYRQKRGDGKVRGESAIGGEEGRGLAEFAMQQNPGPEAMAEFTELATHLLSSLASNELRQIALLRMEGFTNDEIAIKLKLSIRTIQRKLELIRITWQEEDENL